MTYRLVRTAAQAASLSTDPRRARLLVRLLMLSISVGLLAVPCVTQAQDYGQFDNPTDVGYTEYSWPLCVVPPDIPNGYVQPSCLGDATEENTTRLEVKYEDRWLRAGVLMGAQLWAGVEYLRDIIQGARGVIGLVESIVHGRAPAVVNPVALRLEDASDSTGGTASRVRTATTLATTIPYAIDQGRWQTVDALVIRALSTARDAQAAAATLADQSAAVAARLSSAPVMVLPIGSGQPSAFGSTLPPVPIDAGPDAMGPDAALPSPPAPTTDLSGALLSDDDAPNPQVLYARATVMAKGAQMAAAGTLADVQTAREEIAAVAARQATYQRETAWSDLVRSVSHF